MPDTTSVRLLSGVMIAMAHTWDAKLPGFRKEFAAQLGAVYVATPVTDLKVRNALDEIILSLS